MLPLRQEIDAYSRSCERLIAAALLADAIPFTQEEIEWIEYYGTEVTNLINQLQRNFRPQFDHKRETLREFAAACEALLLTDDYSDEEKETIRQSVSTIMTKILVGKEA